MLIAIFKKRNTNSYEFIGSGFLISEKGVFVSCGHNFKNYLRFPNDYYCAVPTNDTFATLYEIHSLNFEYNIIPPPEVVLTQKQLSKQKTPIYRDLMIGSIQGDFTSHEILNRKRPNLKEILSVIGFRNPDKLHFSLNNENNLDITNLKKVECELEIYNRKLSIFSVFNYYFERDVSQVPTIYKYNNSIMLKRNTPCEDDLDVGNGMSGCPIFDETNLVVGIYLGSKELFGIHYMLCSKYIAKFIKYKTNYVYDIYSDLPLRLKIK